jgi:quercetin dioxygenase-like cupin family protein
MTAPKEIINIGGLELRFLLDGDDTNNQMVVFEFKIAPGAKVPVSHYHEDVDELIYGLEGTLTSYISGKRIEVSPGDKCFVPRGEVHYHDNHTDQTVKVLCVLTPASIGPAYFREIADLLKAGGPPDPAIAAEIMKRHGLIAAV